MEENEIIHQSDVAQEQFKMQFERIKISEDVTDHIDNTTVEPIFNDVRDSLVDALQNEIPNNEGAPKTKNKNEELFKFS